MKIPKPLRDPNNWKRLAEAIAVWVIALFIWEFVNNFIDLKSWLSRISLEVWFTTVLGLGTGAGSIFAAKQKERIDEYKSAIAELRGVILANNTATIENSRRLEDLIDGAMLEMRGINELRLLLAEVRSLIDRNRVELASLANEQERQKERLLQGDRLLHFAQLLENVIRDNEQMKAHFDKLKSTDTEL